MAKYDVSRINGNFFPVQEGVLLHGFLDFHYEIYAGQNELGLDFIGGA